VPLGGEYLELERVTVMPTFLKLEIYYLK